MKELKEKRDRKIKQFLNRDGTITAKVYCDDIHYKKNGQYEEIDNTLVKEKDCFINRENDYKIYFKENSKNTLLRMVKDCNYIDIKLQKCNAVKAEVSDQHSKLRSSIFYKNILDGIDFKYEINPTKVKETIILNNKDSAKEKISFIIDTNLQLVLNDKEILAKKGSELIFKFEVPYMYDSNNELNEKIIYSLHKDNSSYNLDLVLDIDWLKNDNILYPVYIDPTIDNTYDGGTVYDTYISSNATTSNKGSEDILKAGVQKIDGVDVIHRTLLKFDLPSLTTGDEVINAYLVLWGYPSDDNTFGGDYVSIHRITENWEENKATWETMSNKYDSRIESLYDACRSTVGIDNNIDFGACTINGDITDLVKKWYVDTPNNGIMLKAAREEYKDSNYPAFFSKNNTVTGSGGGENIQPTLVITYRNQNGLEGYLNYMTQYFTIGATNINTYNGNLVGIFKVGATIAGNLSANVNLVYNTNDVILENNTIYGKGYRLSLDQTIVDEYIEEDNYHRLKYVDEDGTIHYFYKNYTYDDEGNLQESSIYYDEDGLNLSILKDDNSYIMTDKNNDTITFTINNEVGYLSELKDINDNKITINRDSNNNITKIVDANNAEINFVYETNMISIVSPDSTTQLNYTDGLLTSINSLKGTTTFVYNDNNLITDITDVTGIKINYEYYSNIPYRVKKVTQYGLNNTLGNYFSLNYEFNSTSIIDNTGKISTLIFNSTGNLISKNSLATGEDIKNAYSISREYGDDFYGKNQITQKVVPVKYVKNYLSNTSFENDNMFFSSEGVLVSEFTTEYKFSGNRSLSVNATGYNQVLSQEVTVTKGNYYTFSGYFKNAGELVIALSYLDSDGNIVGEQENIDVSDDFVRSDVTIYYDESATSDLSIQIITWGEGMFYIDDVQLEEGEVANNYNMIENSDFSLGLSDWTLDAYEPDDDSIILNPNDYFSVVNFNNNQNTALKVNMLPHNLTTFKKTLKVNGKLGDIFHLSFWYKNEGIYCDSEVSSNNFYLMYTAPVGEETYTEIMQTEKLPVNLNYWQYFSSTFIAENDYESIDLIFNQSRNANNLYITDLCLYKDISSEHYSYDENGNIIAIGNSNDDVNSFNYDSNNQLIKSTTAKGKNFRMEYDNEKPDRLLSAISSMGISNQVKYDSFGNPICTRISKKAYEELINGSYKIRGKGTSKYLNAKNSKNLLMESNSCSNPVWILEKVDDNFKIKFSDMENYELSYCDDVVFLGVNNQNNLFCLEENDNGSYHIMQKDSDKYLKICDNSTLTFEELINDDPTFEFYFESLDDIFIETTATYTTDGRFVTSVTDSNLNTTNYETDTVTGLLKSMTNANNITTYYGYNDKQQLTSVTTGDKSVTYIYDDKNLLSKIKHGTKEYNFTYNDFLNSKQIKLGDNITLLTNEYEENNGNLYKTIYGNNHQMIFDYDDFDRVKTLHKMDRDYHYKYDNNGNVAKILSNDYIEKITYDIKKRIDEYRYNDFKIKYVYDSNDNVTNKKYKLNNSSLNIENTFDKDDLLTKIVLANEEIDYQYDGLGRIINRNINNSFDTTYEYVSSGKRTSDLIESVKNGNNKYSYIYDNLGNITDVYYNDSLIKKYYYDDLSELIKEDDLVQNERIEYTYDTSGNLLSKVTTNIDDNTIINTDTYFYENSNWEDQLTKFNSQEITYDTIGNPLTIGSNITLSWINGRSLNSYQDTSENLNISYKYNIDGIRIGKTVNNIETNYYLEGDQIIYEKTGNDLIQYLYDSMGIIGLMYNSNIYYYVKNLQGDIIGILNDDYEQIVSYEYDSWGKVLSIKDNEGNIITDSNNIGIINPFRYRGYYYDNETKLYYLNTRYYNPIWCRFLNADTALGANQDILSSNLYAYVSNNPIAFSDPSGAGFGKWLKKQFKKACKFVKPYIDKACDKLGISIEINVTTNSSTKDNYIVANVERGADTSKTVVKFGSDTNKAKVKLNVSTSSPIESSVGFEYKKKNNKTIGYEANLTGVKLSFGESTDEFSYSYDFGCELGYCYSGGTTSVTVDDITQSEYIKYSFNALLPVVLVLAANPVTAPATATALGPALGSIFAIA